MIVLSLSLALAFFGGLLWGSVKYTPADLYRAALYALKGGGEGGLDFSAPEAVASLILFQIRLPRLLLAIMVGVSLGVSGASFQGVFRNSLADPYVIGASSGAALGAAIAMVMGFSFSGPVSAVSLFAFIGALGTVFLAFVISRAVGNPPPAVALLLAGTALSTFFSSLLSLIMVLRDRDLHRVYYWLLGSLNGTTWPSLPATFIVMFAGCLLVFLCRGPLDMLLQGEEVAESLGTDVKKTRALVALGASLAVAAAVSAAGIIGFVGLIAPHSVRLITGPSHKRLLPASALAGALLVLLSDIVARSAGNIEFPIGVITSLAGAPFFIYLLARYGRNIGRF
jgi:iron complex transport system permease protein